MCYPGIWRGTQLRWSWCLSPGWCSSSTSPAGSNATFSSPRPRPLSRHCLALSHWWCLSLFLSQKSDIFHCWFNATYSALRVLSGHCLSVRSHNLETECHHWAPSSSHCLKQFIFWGEKYSGLNIQIYIHSIVDFIGTWGIDNITHIWNETKTEKVRRMAKPLNKSSEPFYHDSSPTHCHHNLISGCLYVGLNKIFQHG